MDVDAHTWSSIITSAVVPVVIISACGLIHLALSNRLAMVFTRLRSLQRERLAEKRSLKGLRKGGNDLEREAEAIALLGYLEQQTTFVLRRARCLRNGLLCLILTMLSLIITSLLIGFSLIYPSLDILVMSLFIVGLLFFLSGLCFAFSEIRMAIQPLDAESRFVHRFLQD